jgi:hypothetical protein
MNSSLSKEEIQRLRERAVSGDAEALDALFGPGPKQLGTGEVVVVDKLEAARRQLETAIALFFDNGDPVSIHTLVRAAHDIIRDLNECADGEPMIAEGCSDLVRRPANYFKHADRKGDPDSFLEFKPVVNLHWMFSAVWTLEKISGEKVSSFIAIQEWFALLVPEIFPSSIPNSTLVKLFEENDRRGFLEAVLKMSSGNNREAV